MSRAEPLEGVVTARALSCLRDVREMVKPKNKVRFNAALDDGRPACIHCFAREDGDKIARTRANPRDSGPVGSEEGTPR